LVEIRGAKQFEIKTERRHPDGMNALKKRSNELKILAKLILIKHF
jgi:hypothetical protein